jgi:F0F1-type ATP synthase epsilon subunit
MQFHLTLQTPHATVFEGEVDGVKLTTLSGEMEILPQHTTLVGIIDFSEIVVRKGATTEKYLMRSGAVNIEMGGEHVQLLAQDITEEGRAERKTLEEYLNFVTEKLADGDLSDYQLKFLKGQQGSLEKTIAVLTD